MTTRKDAAATLTFPATELDPPIVDWSVEDMDKEFMAFKTPIEMW